MSELPSLPLTPGLLSNGLSQWSMTNEEKIAFLASAAAVYESSGNLSKSLELHILALEISEAASKESLVEKALVLAISVADRFSLDDVLRVQGVKQNPTGKMGEMVRLFTEVDELLAVKQGQEWLGANGPYLESFGELSFLVEGCVPYPSSGLAQLTLETVLRKLRLIALTTLCARSTTKQLQYLEVASTLSIERSEVEAWVIDGSSCIAFLTLS